SGAGPRDRPHGRPGNRNDRGSCSVTIAEETCEALRTSEPEQVIEALVAPVDGTALPGLETLGDRAAVFGDGTFEIVLCEHPQGHEDVLIDRGDLFCIGGRIQLQQM